jgi:SSS family solute:Na+ symporter
MNGFIAQALTHAHFRLVDWLVVALYLAGTTWLGARLAGRQATIRDFFLGGRKLPWWAVTGSNIATEISAVTFIGVPSLVFAAGGDFRYLQFALGSIAARTIIAWWFVPAYYAREIYSPYQYMGQRLGPGVDVAATGLFMLGATLAQSVRVFTTAIVLQIVTGIDLWVSIWIIGAVAIVWTLMGGITTVIWTDVIQFVVLVAGAVVALLWVFHAVPGGATEVLRLGREAGKFRVLDLALNPAHEYTLWSGLFGMAFLNLAALGTDQVMAQRIFCCRDVREARRAVNASNLGLFVPVLMLLVGAGLYAYFRHFPLSSDEAAMVAARGDRIFPIFIVKVLPIGVTGLVIAAVFAAAISTLDGTLAALSQTTVMSIYVPLRRALGARDLSADDHHAVTISRCFVVVWGVLLSAAATLLIPVQKRNLIDLALGVPAYTYGALLGTLLLALLPTRCDDRGLAWGIAASVLAVVAINVHDPAWISWVVGGGCGLLAITGVVAFAFDPPRIALIVAAAGAIIGLHWLTAAGSDGSPRLTLAYPWHYPIGTAMTFVLGWGLARRKVGALGERCRVD